jgi:formylglycine-generating enzyme required for sulfatase activity
MASLPMLTTAVLADYVICNNTWFSTFSALAYEDKQQGLATVGWFEIKPHSCETVVIGPVKGKVLYHFAETPTAHPGHVDWWWPTQPTDQTFCVGQQQTQPFVIYKKDVKESCKLSGYGERRLGKVTDDGAGGLFWRYFPLGGAFEKEIGPKDVFWECGGCPKMVVVPAGEFMMGSEDKEPGRRADEAPRHKVTIRQPFAVSERWVSRGEFETFAKATGHDAGDKCAVWKDGKLTEEAGRSFRSPGFAQDGGDPVVCVNFNDAKSYIAWASKQPGKPYRLPSEAEWEYVMRAGTTTPFWWGATITTAQANYNGNLIYGGGAKGEFRQRTVSSALKPNAWAIYGLGNAAEWTEDCWNDSYQSAPWDGSARTDGNCSQHAVRGGSWASDPVSLRSAARAGVENGTRRNDLGFRVARPLDR